MSQFKFTPKQLQAQEIAAGNCTHILYYGGSRSGKTFFTVRTIVMRALKAPGSRHAVFRFRFNALKSSVVITLENVMKICFPSVSYEFNKSDLIATFPNGSTINFAGLDDKARTEKILGQEYATLYFNECSQIPYDSVNMALTRLAQRVEVAINGKIEGLLKPRAFYDANPPNRAHWLYRKFIQKIDPETKEPIKQQENYISFQMNPMDNLDNLPPNYMETLEALPARQRRRFLAGEFADATPNALFPQDNIDQWRHDGETPDMVRIVVAVDPSGAGDTDNADNDAIGIVVVGLGTDGNAYLLEDCTVKAGPATWSQVATSAYERHDADLIVGETNYGGAMVEQVIRAARPSTPFKKITSSRGKVLRAEPFSPLYVQGKVRHVGMFPELEDELAAFSTAGYTGGRSPNRADALIFGLAELFPGMTRKKQEVEFVDTFYVPQGQDSWMMS